MESGKTPNLQERMIEFLDKYKINVDRSKIKGYPVPFEPLPKVYTNNVLLTGDAAGFVDPLSGGGIELAMISGEKAAKVAAEAVQANDFSEKFLSRYVDECSFIYNFIKKMQRDYKIFRTAFKLKLLYPLMIYAKVDVWIKSKILKQKRMSLSGI
jgi:flavin-dependent dehydrogenase